MILGLRGVTVVVASGDTGIQGSAQAGGAPPTCTPFQPTYPASSPYVTTVGGTQFSDHVLPLCDLEQVYAVGTEAYMPFACPDDDVGEIVCSTDTGAMITSGGGMSNRFERPWYQDNLVPYYLTKYCGEIVHMFNSTGRGYPDISAVGQNVPSAWKGRIQMAGGTSSSAPIVAGILSLLNGERLAEGLPSLGFVNPFLYTIGEEYPAALNDIVAGNNSGGNRLLPEYVTCEHGFVAQSGWDAATGLGSLNFAAILPHVVPNPRNGNAPFNGGGDDGDGNDVVIGKTELVILGVGISVVVSLVTSVIVVMVMTRWGRRKSHVNDERPLLDEDNERDVGSGNEDDDRGVYRGF
jgi:tripeptidyl-peptidase I